MLPQSATPPSLRLLLLGLLLAGCSGHVEETVVTAERAVAPEALPPLPAAATRSGFTDVTAAAGIRAAHDLATADLENIVDAVGAGAAFADLDDDGWLDLIVLGGAASPAAEAANHRSAGVLVYRNLRNGRFVDVTSRSGIPRDVRGVAVAVGDVDGDGARDLYIADRGPNRLFRNRGNGTFRDITTSAGVDDERFTVGAVFFDMDQDGDLDLYVTNYLDYDPSEQNFFPPDGYPGPLAYRAESDALFRNRGDGTFENVSAESGVSSLQGRGMSLAAADFDGDGDTDLFVANDATENFLLLNDSSGRFTESGLLAGVAMGENGEQTSAMACDVGDLDRDGFLDLAVSDTAFGAIYRQVGRGFFVDEVMQSGVGLYSGQYVSWGQNLIDFDNDGLLDLFVTNGGLHHLVGWEDLLLRNVGDVRFEDASGVGGAYFRTRHVGRGSIVGDYDNDGDMDLFITNLEGRHFLLRNDIAGESAWITLDLVGERARDGYGARVELRVGGEVLVAESRSRSAYLGQGDHRVHFGLGPGDRPVDQIRVHWPSGETSILKEVAPRQILHIREGT